MLSESQTMEEQSEKEIPNENNEGRRGAMQYASRKLPSVSN